MTRIAIIGAGIGGLTLAEALTGHAQVTVFEMGRGVGGRTASRREGSYRFDHGAPCFTVRTPAFETWLAPLRAAGIVAEWSGPVVTLAAGRVQGEDRRGERLHVSVPGMNAIAGHLASRLDVRSGIEVAPLHASAAPYRLTSVAGEDLGSFDLVVSTAPAHQTRALFRAVAPEAGLAGEGNCAAPMKPRHALMVAAPGRWTEDWIAARVMEGPLRWIRVDSTKPGREQDVTTLVAHTRSRWSRHHTETPADLLAPILLHALRAALPVEIGEPAVVRAHRWRSAQMARATHPGPWIAPDRTLAATGDWATSSRVERVWAAARDLAAQILGRTP